MIIPNLSSNSSNGYTVTASQNNSWSGGGQAYKAFDSSTSTGWLSTSIPAWLAIDCGSIQSVKSFKIRSRHNSSSTYNGFPVDFEILGSNDGTSWTLIEIYIGVSWSNNEEKEFTFLEVKSYQHFKINVTNGSTNNVIINGFQLFEEVVEEQPVTTTGGSFLFGAEKLGNGETIMRVSEDGGETFKQYVPKDGFREVYIMAGQSNMVGHGNLNELPIFNDADRCSIYGYDEQWDAGQEPMSEHSGIVHNVFYDNEDKASMGMAFANRIAELSPCNEIGLIPCAKGGSIISQWQKDSSTSTFYGAMMARIDAALQEPNTILKGMVFYQGESDAVNSTRANGWKANFEQFITDLRADLGYELPVVHVEIGDTTDSTGRPYTTTVRNQQRDVELDKNDYVSARGYPLFDSVHLKTSGLVSLGIDAANKMNQINELI